MQPDYAEQFGLILIGDEILFGRRQDSHFGHFRQLLASHGLRLSRCWLLQDEAESLTAHLHFSMQQGGPVFVCGGIGATPDDLTRPCAAEAAGVPLERHPQARALIEERFGEAAYPTRIRMADLPAGSQLIPNPYNRIPGFSLQDHHFLPGFPEMAWPMAEWVLETHYASRHSAIQEGSLWITGTPESSLVPLMEAFEGRFSGLKLYSLPRLGKPPMIELGLRGRGDMAGALAALKQALEQADIPFQSERSKP